MKYLLIILIIIILSVLTYGLISQSPTDNSGDFYIGCAVLALFFIWMPLFIYHRYKGKDISKYMINDKTFKKIKDEAETFID